MRKIYGSRGLPGTALARYDCDFLQFKGSFPLPRVNFFS